VVLVGVGVGVVCFCVEILKSGIMFEPKILLFSSITTSFNELKSMSSLVSNIPFMVPASIKISFGTTILSFVFVVNIASKEIYVLVVSGLL
jgi:hypothetical protein